MRLAMLTMTLKSNPLGCCARLYKVNDIGNINKPIQVAIVANLILRILENHLRFLARPLPSRVKTMGELEVVPEGIS